MNVKSSKQPSPENGGAPEPRLPPLDFQSIANRAPGLVDVYRYPEGQYVYVNNAIRHTLGFEPVDMLAGGLEFFISRIHPDDANELADKLTAACQEVEQLRSGVDDNQPFASFEYRMRRKDGRWIWLHTDAGVYSRSAQGKLEYVINTCIDITVQKTAEAKLLKAAKQLKASQSALRSEHEHLIELNLAKDEFVSIASHQLRTPATIVKQYLGLMMQGYVGVLTDEQSKVLQSAFDSNERELSIISDLLNASRMDAGQVRLQKMRTDLVNLIRRVVDEQQDKYQARHQHLIFTNGEKPIKVNIDERLVRMVVENLLDNASKYSPEGKGVEVSLTTHDSKAVLQVIDHGYGISEQDQKKLFQKFSRIDTAETHDISGTGLGLYWAKKVVDLHGGGIAVSSTPIGGTTFIVELPIGNTNR
jgi:PAS domain S-box-containing protein